LCWLLYLSDGCLPNICRTGLDPGICQPPVGRRSRQLLAPAAVAAAAAVAAVASAAGPAASGAAATSFGENVAHSRQKKYGERKIRENSLTIKTRKYSLRCSQNFSAKIQNF
jgi:hypothetical protein